MFKLAGIFLALPFLIPAHAQQITRHEAGIGLYSQTGTVYAGTSAAYKQSLSGPLARYTFNLNRSVALEASATDSFNMQPTWPRAGGHQLLVLGGLKAGVRRRYFGIYGRLNAGAASYTRGDELLTQPPVYYRETHFALQQGVAMEGYISRRNIVRLDIDENLTASFRKIYQQTSSLTYSPGSVPHHLGIALSVGHRFGAFEDAPELSPHTEHISVGALFPLQIREHLLEQDVRVEGGGGAWIGTPLWRFLSADILAFDIPHNDHTAGAQDGGTSFSAFAGPKLGFHLGKLGLFVKGRPGITRFSRTVFEESLFPRSLFLVDHPQIDFTLDTGGVIEYSPLRHALFRFEAGNAFIHYHAHTYTFTNAPGTFGSSPSTFAVYSPPVHNSSILFLTGLGWRF